MRKQLVTILVAEHFDKAIGDQTRQKGHLSRWTYLLILSTIRLLTFCPFVVSGHIYIALSICSATNNVTSCFLMSPSQRQATCQIFSHETLYYIPRCTVHGLLYDFCCCC